MFNTDKITEERAREGGPVRVAIIGAGPLGRVIALQLTTDLPDIRLVAVADDSLDAARRVYAAAGMPVPRVIESPFGLSSAIKAGDFAVTQNWRLLCESDEIDAVIEAAVAPEHGLEVVRVASESGKHVVPTSTLADETAETAHRSPADRLELVRVEVNATNFFDIQRPGHDGPTVATQTNDPPQRPAAPA